MVGLFIFLINPTNFYHRDGRYWMIGVLGKIILAPFFHVGFADFWLADQVVYFYNTNYIQNILYFDLNSFLISCLPFSPTQLRATLKQSFYVSFCLPYAHPSDHKNFSWHCYVRRPMPIWMADGGRMEVFTSFQNRHTIATLIFCHQRKFVGNKHCWYSRT